MVDPNDELIARCLDGDQAAWNALVSRYHRVVASIPLRMGMTRESADDITQTVFIELFRNLDRIREPSQLTTWLFTVTTRECWRVRDNGRSFVLGLDSDKIVEPSGENFTEDLADAALLQDALAELGEPCRSLLTAMFLDPTEPSYAEIALRIGRPVGSIGPLRMRCLERLRELILETDRTDV